MKTVLYYIARKELSKDLASAFDETHKIVAVEDIMNLEDDKDTNIVFYIENQILKEKIFEIYKSKKSFLMATPIVSFDRGESFKFNYWSFRAII